MLHLSSEISSTKHKPSSIDSRRLPHVANVSDALSQLKDVFSNVAT